MAGISRAQGRYLYARTDRIFKRSDTVSSLAEDQTECLRCAGTCRLTGLCEKCDRELSRIVRQELRRYASEKEVEEFCCMHFIDYELDQ